MEGMDIQCPQIAKQLVVDGLAVPPVSCSPNYVDSCGLDAISLAVDPEHSIAEPGDQIHFEVDESLSFTPHDIYSGHTPDPVANNQPKATGSVVSYVEALRSGILADGTGSLGMGAASMSLCSILEVDRPEALSISNCPEVGVVSVHNALSFPKGGVPSQCSNSEQLCGSLDVLSCDANSGAPVEFDAVPPRVSGQDTLGEGFKLKSVLKKPKRPK
ncbi:hypothetical protein Nepgr_021089 [Nepenthes gracilis]|uniref:Uncharacterized protein n=1 Tax=Nepenthes gracilis TaxID=150966 RepID=A0AAD3SW97_NEPGR|nr:hypothetical protein Nepgr_021089 [Nepenthes gracilis]